MKRIALSWLIAMTAASLVVAADDDETTDEKKKSEMPVYGETMVVTASRTEEALADAPVAITVISAEKLATTPGDNYADVLRGVPGLNIIQTSARDLNFKARGAASTLSTSQLALVDGRSIYQDFFGFVMWDLLPVGLDEIDQIEVVRGPGSAVWGANALNGVINVRTKSPSQLDGGQVMLTAGEVGTRGGSVRYADTVGQWSYKLSGAYLEQDPWERPTTLPSGEPMPAAGVFENEGTKQPKLDARLDFIPKSGNELWSFRGGWARTSGIIHTGIGPFKVVDSTNMGFGSVEYHRGSFETRVYANRIDGDGTNLLNGLDFLFNTTTWVGEMSGRTELGENNSLVWGGNARQAIFDLSIAPRNDNRTEAGLFVEDQLSLGDYVTVNAGARLDWFDTIGSTFSPRTSLIVKPAPNHSFRFAYNRAYRAPSLINNYLETQIFNAVQLPTGTFVFPTDAVGNEDLNEEVVDAFEIGYTVTVARRATLTASIYRNRTKDSIDFFPASFYSSDDPPPSWPLPPTFVPPFTLPKSFSYRNVGEVVDKGLELSADVQLAPGISTTLGYAYQEEPEVSSGGSAVPLELGKPPRHQWSASLNANSDKYFGSVSISYTDEALWTDVLDSRFWGTTPSYTLINGTVGVRLGASTPLTLVLKANNITDEHAQQHVFGDIIRRKVAAEVRVNF